ncbi:MAG: sulfotransferase family protein [Egibacteraceae bacterium]
MTETTPAPSCGSRQECGTDPAQCSEARIEAPIVILGAPRSGTTLLAQVLGSHPDVALASEPRMIWRYGNDRRSDELRPEHATPRVVAGIHAGFAAILRQRGATRLVEKSPSNSVRPGFVDAVFPDARFVHITRNGWGAVPSMRDFWARRAQGFDGKQVRKLRRRVGEARLSQLPFYARELLSRAVGGLSGHVPLYGPRLAGLQAIADELGRLEASALQWRACIDQSSTFGRGLGPARYLELRLEELDVETIGRILAFCGLPPAAVVFERFETTYRREAAVRRVPLTAREQVRIAACVMPANAWLGYPGDPGDPSDATSASPLRGGRRLRVAYLVGAKNCGSTMLDALIGQAEGARSLGEVGRFPRFAQGGPCDCGLAAASCDPCRAVVAGLDRSSDLRRLNLLFRLPLKERRLHWTLVGTPARRQYAQVFDQMFSLVAEATSSWLLVDSSKNISRAAALALDSEHDIRVIHLVRDGRGFLSSRRRRTQLDGQSYQPALALAGWLAKNLAATVLLRPRLAPDRYLLCRYEDLVADPETVLGRIGDFLGTDLVGVGTQALEQGVRRTHLFEPQRRADYGLVRIERGRLTSQRWSGARNLAFWCCGGFVSALWRYDRSQSYLEGDGR